MPLPLDKNTVLNRLRDYPHDNYLYLGGIAKGVAMAVAALVLLQIFADFSDRWYKLFPWIGALAASLVSYLKWGRGVLLTNSRANTLDNILPLLMGIMEFFLFAMLIEDKDHPLFWRHWPLALAAHSLLAVLLVVNRYFSMSVTQDFESDLQPIATKMKKWMSGDIGGAAAVTVFAILAWAVLNYWFTSVWGFALVTGVFAIGLFGIVVQANTERRRIDDEVSQIKENHSQ